jgi:hypothetical protein
MTGPTKNLVNSVKAANMRKRPLLFLLLVASTANAGPYDKEYKQARTAAYEAARTHFLDQQRTLYFAVGCGVIDGQSAAPLNMAEQTAMRTAIDQGPGDDPQLIPMMQKAQREGAGMAHDTVHHACDYWHKNADAVYALRQEAEEARATLP